MGEIPKVRLKFPYPFATPISALALAGISAAYANAFPAKPLRLVVPFAAGGGGDGAARVLAPPLSLRLGQQVVIDNRGGAGGIIGMEIVKSAVADGYTLLLTTAGFAAMPALYQKLPFDPVTDYAPIITAQSGIFVLVVNPALPVKSVQELIAYARANPAKLDFASAGTGSTIHLAGELLKSMAQVRMTHVPYKGAAPALTDVLAGQVQTMFATAQASLPLAKQGRLRALGVTSGKRSALAPELPTLAESGLTGYEVAGWYGLAAPARTPVAIVKQLNDETNQVLKAPELATRLQAQGLEVVGGSSAEASALIQRDVVRWIKVIREAGIVRQ
jgi:tripartite-type tricarboxylate transporter receptor subunit TctC